VNQFHKEATHLMWILYSSNARPIDRFEIFWGFLCWNQRENLHNSKHV